MEGSSYLFLVMAFWLIVATALGSLATWAFLRKTAGSSNGDRFAELYQASEKHRRELQAELDESRAGNGPSPKEVTELKARISQLESDLASSASEHEHTFEGQKTAWNTERASLMAHINSLQAQVDAGGGQPVEAPILQPDPAVVAERDALKAERDALQTALTNAQSAAPSEELESVRRERDGLHAQVESMRVEMDRMKQAPIDEMQTLELQNSKQKLTELTQRYDLLDQERERLQFEASAMQAVKSELEGVKNELAEEKRKGWALDQELGSLRKSHFDEEKVAQDHEAEIARLRAELEEHRATAQQSVPSQDFEVLKSEHAQLKDEVELANLRQVAFEEQKARLAELEQRVVDLTSAPTVDTSALEALQARVDAFEEEKRALQAQVDRAEMSAVESATIIANLESQLAEAEKASGSAEFTEAALAERERHIEGLTGQIANFEQEREALGNRVGEHAQANARLEAQVSELQAELTQIRDGHEETLSELQAHRDRRAELESKLETLVQERNALARMNDELHHEVDSVRARHTELQDLLEEKSQLEDELAARTHKLMTLESEATAMEAERASWRTQGETLTEMTARVNSLEALVGELHAENERLKQELAAPIAQTETPRQEPVRVPRASGDDLEQIIGVGPVSAKVLAEMGYDSFEKVAAMEARDIERVGSLIENFERRVTKEKWREQAGILARMKQAGA